MITVLEPLSAGLMIMFGFDLKSLRALRSSTVKLSCLLLDMLKVIWGLLVLLYKIVDILMDIYCFWFPMGCFYKKSS